MYVNKRLVIGKNSEKELCIIPKMINKHGLITGASGSGKTTTLKVMAETFSEASIPVFLIDIKGDLAGTVNKGVEQSFIKERIDSLKLDEFKYQSFPVTFFDIYKENGHPIRTTITNVGSRLLSKMLNLSDTQEQVLAIVFQIAEDENLEIIDLEDLKSLLTYVVDNKDKYIKKYGNITTQSIGAIQRSLLVLIQDGGEAFFGLPAFNLQDLIHYDANTGFGTINIFDAQKLFKKPTLYATFLIWMLNEIYNTFPEVGDLEKPKLALFFDEAHLMFSDMPNYLIKQITQIVKLIRSKGVGVYFISQSPSDIPEEILSQLGNKIQHTLRSYTPSDEKKVKAAANSFRQNPKFNTVEEIKALKTGEALISFLNEYGEPSIVEKAFILPPESQTGVISDTNRLEVIRNSYLYNKYENLNNILSASEKIELKEKEEEKEVKVEKKETKKKTTKKDKTPKYVKKLANSTVNTIGRKLGNKIFNSLFK
jgi:hypothetical protein